MVRLFEEGLASPGEESPAGSGQPFPRALLPDATCPEAALAKANRELRMLIDCKRALARAQQESGLLGEICRILVGPGGYRLAWVGFADEDSDRTVRAVAQAGHDCGYVQRLRVSWSDDERGHGPTGCAIRERKAQVCRHIDSDPNFLPWREEAGREGYRSSIALPLLLDGTCIGALSIYADRPDAFDDTEVALLEELAADLSFGLKALRTEAEKCRQQRQIARLAQMVRMQSAMNSAMFRIRDRDELLREACRLATGLGGFFGASVWNVVGSGRWAWLKYRTGALISDTETLQRIEICSGTGSDPSLAGRALRTGKVTVCADITRTDVPVAARELLLAYGIRSLIALPLIVDEKRVAVLTLTAKETAPAEDGELLQLLEDMTIGLSFALRSLEHAEAAQYLARFDPLTGLAKRALFGDRLDAQLQLPGEAPEQVRVAVIAFDVHGLGSINATHGERFGDLALQSLAERLKRYCGGDVRLGYLGAGTYVLVERAVESVLDGIQIELDGALLDETFEIDGREVRLSVSYGAARHPQDGTTGALLVQRAEVALKRAKESGEHCLHFRPEMSRETTARVALEGKLRTAIDEQQFVLHYQPQINLSTGEIDAVEALLRWRDGGEEPVLPGRFLPILESSGMIVPVGNWTLLKAVEDLEGWFRAGYRPFRVAVNVSAVQLKQREFVHGLLGLAERLAPLAGFGLDIEITETTLLQDLEGTSRKLRELREAGIRIALDDFGTGYSSLALLSKLPVDVLKIDRSFVSGLPDDQASVTLVASIVELASAFDLVTVAEGVETAEQLAALRALRCRQSQGFFHSAAVPTSELEQMLTRRGGPHRAGVRAF
jgi:diguanylate cyclase (GGDEF)-like protein